MARPRVIPCLLLRKAGLVKGEKFSNHRYVGDCVNAVRIFNGKQVDELVVLDIDATREGREPNYELIEQIAGECFMPLAYGGGVSSTEQMARLYRLGCEKVIVTTHAAEGNLIREAAKRFGRQSVVVGVDVRKKMLGGYDVMLHAGSRKHAMPLEKYLAHVEAEGAGEIMLQSIHRDGTQSGYDLDCIRLARSIVKVPIVAAGGAGGVDDLARAIAAGASAAAAGALFVFQGKHRAVLINVPSGPILRKAFEAHTA